MNQMQKQVMEWHKIFGVPIRSEPYLLDKERAKLRANLILEEVMETIDGLGCFIDCRDGNSRAELCYGEPYGDLIEIADGMADSLYVIFGTAVEMGIDIQKVFNEVHRSNMSKMWTIREWGEYQRNEHYERESLSYRLVGDLHENEDSKCVVVTRLDGKVIKSPSYLKANIKKALFNSEV